MVQGMRIGRQLLLSRLINRLASHRNCIDALKSSPMNIQLLRAKRAIKGNSSAILNRQAIADVEGTKCGTSPRTPRFGSSSLLTGAQTSSAVILKVLP
jgi:hypothetical protein